MMAGSVLLSVMALLLLLLLLLLLEWLELLMSGVVLLLFLLLLEEVERLEVVRHSQQQPCKATLSATNVNKPTIWLRAVGRGTFRVSKSKSVLINEGFFVLDNGVCVALCVCSSAVEVFGGNHCSSTHPSDGAFCDQRAVDGAAIGDSVVRPATAGPRKASKREM